MRPGGVEGEPLVPNCRPASSREAGRPFARPSRSESLSTYSTYVEVQKIRGRKSFEAACRDIVRAHNSGPRVTLPQQAAAFLLFLLMLCAAFAQSATGPIVGTARDTGGAILRGVGVEIRNDATSPFAPLRESPARHSQRNRPRNQVVRCFGERQPATAQSSDSMLPGSAERGVHETLSPPKGLSFSG